MLMARSMNDLIDVELMSFRCAGCQKLPAWYRCDRLIVMGCECSVTILDYSRLPFFPQTDREWSQWLAEVDLRNLGSPLGIRAICDPDTCMRTIAPPPIKTSVIKHESRRAPSSYSVASIGLELSRKADGTVNRDSFRADCILALAILKPIENQLTDSFE